MTAVLVTGLFGLFTAVAGTVFGYWLGHRQTRNEQQAAVLIELRRKYLKLKDQLLVFSVPLPASTSELEQVEAMQPGIDEMTDYFHSERIYLDPELVEKVRWLNGGFLQHFVHMRDALRSDAGLSPMDGSFRAAFVRARSEMEKWRAEELPELLEDLEVEIRRLLSTRETLMGTVRELLGRRG